MELLGATIGDQAAKGIYKTDYQLLAEHGKAMLQDLKVMHDLGLVHRDVKSTNFCLPSCTSHTGGVVILDMGFAGTFKASGEEHMADYVCLMVVTSQLHQV
jgi:tRNA A-37 threonylcarbamoyl transferase component Bud32